jgi:hypothetical protein
MQKIVTDAAKKAGIQEPVRTRFEGHVRRQITADSFVAYWRDRMRAAGVSDKVLLDYLIGYQISARDQFSDKQVVETYRKAEACLKIPIRAE